MEVVTTPQIKPAHYRPAPAGSASSSASVPQVRDARFELDVADLCMKHLQKLKATGVLEVEDRGEAVRKIRPAIAGFGQYTKEQLEAAALSVS